MKTMTKEQRDIVEKLFDRMAAECARGAFLAKRPTAALEDVKAKVKEMKTVLTAFEDALDLSAAATVTLERVGR